MATPNWLTPTGVTPIWPSSAGRMGALPSPWATSARPASAPRPTAKTRQHAERLADLERAVRANRQLAVALQAQGLNEDAGRFAYRAQVLQARVLRRQYRIGQYFFSAFLDLLAGYGYRPWRSLVAYLLVIAGFALTFYIQGALGGHHLNVNQRPPSYEPFHARILPRAVPTGRPAIGHRSDRGGHWPADRDLLHRDIYAAIPWGEITLPVHTNKPLTYVREGRGEIGWQSVATIPGVRLLAEVVPVALFDGNAVVFRGLLDVTEGEVAILV